jgi:protein-S-isoprenylcysteine O-methyltransferase Ste14
MSALTLKGGKLVNEKNERSYWAAKIIVALLFIGGVLAVLMSLFSFAGGLFGVLAGLPLLFGGIAAIAVAQLIELLTDIANHLWAIRANTERKEFTSEQQALLSE